MTRDRKETLTPIDVRQLLDGLQDELEKVSTYGKFVEYEAQNGAHVRILFDKVSKLDHFDKYDVTITKTVDKNLQKVHFVLWVKGRGIHVTDSDGTRIILDEKDVDKRPTAGPVITQLIERLRKDIEPRKETGIASGPPSAIAIQTVRDIGKVTK